MYICRNRWPGRTLRFRLQDHVDVRWIGYRKKKPFFFFFFFLSISTHICRFCTYIFGFSNWIGDPNAHDGEKTTSIAAAGSFVLHFFIAVQLVGFSLESLQETFGLLSLSPFVKCSTQPTSNMRGLLCFLMSIHIYVYDEPMNELLPSTYGQAKRSNVLPVRYQNYPKEKKKHLPTLLPAPPAPAATAARTERHPSNDSLRRFVAPPLRGLYITLTHTSLILYICTSSCAPPQTHHRPRQIQTQTIITR